MINNQWLVAAVCGLFVSFTTIIDWYLNAPLRVSPLSEKELFLYEMFLEQPKRVFPPPNLPTYWWMVVLVAGVMFFLGFVSALVVITFYQTKFIAIQNVYLKIIAMAGLIIGLSAGYFLSVGAYMLPLVWKIYLSTVTAMLTFIGTYLVFRAPYRIYLWRKKKKFYT